CDVPSLSIWLPSRGVSGPLYITVVSGSRASSFFPCLVIPKPDGIPTAPVGFLCVVSQGDKESREGIQKIFSLFDDDRTGTITLKNLKRVAKELGETMSEDELREMLERADSNGDGEISFEDFYAIMTKKTFP
ncbi:EF hand protein, partial [Toxoplasma gondii FOU]